MCVWTHYSLCHIHANCVFPRYLLCHSHTTCVSPPTCCCCWCKVLVVIELLVIVAGRIQIIMPCHGCILVKQVRLVRKCALKVDHVNVMLSVHRLNHLAGSIAQHRTAHSLTKHRTEHAQHQCTRPWGNRESAVHDA